MADAFHHLLQQRGSTSWLHHVHSWLACLQSQDIVTAPGSDGTFGFSVDDVLAKLKCRYLADIHTQPSSKALTYWQIRGTIEYKYQTYLSTVQNQHHCRALSRFRVVSHWLQVHRLAFCGVPHEQRWCTFCSKSGLQILDDEDHSIFSCPAFATLRAAHTRLYFYGQDQMQDQMQQSNIAAFFNNPDQQSVAHFVEQCRLLVETRSLK